LAITIWLVSSAALAAAAAWAGSNWWLGVVAAAAAAAAVLALVRTAVRKLGGTTGDVLGAGVELATTALLVMLAR
jgi:adenosylcobinamide-GDP ribazoletransferase